MRAAHLLDDLNSQFNGKNNGDFSAAPSTMMLFGWTSKGAACFQASIDLMLLLFH
jgi:hypothetical protein